MEAVIKEIADLGVQAIIVGGSISDLAQHFCNKYDLLTLKTQSKFELQRICRTLGATTLVRLVQDTTKTKILYPPHHLGCADRGRSGLCRVDLC